MQDYEVTEDLLTPQQNAPVPPKQGQSKNPRPTKKPMKTSTRIILIVLAATIAIGAMFAVSYLRSNIDSDKGNTNANMNPIGSEIAQSGKWTYFSGNGLYKTDGKTTVKVKDRYYWQLNIYKKKLYAYAGRSKGDSDFDKIISMDLDGRNEKVIYKSNNNDSSIENIRVYKNKIYTLQENKDNWAVHSMNLDGSQQKTIIEDDSIEDEFAFSVDNYRIYFQKVTDEDHAIFSVGLDGGDETKILNWKSLDDGKEYEEYSSRFSYFAVDRQYLYYVVDKHAGCYNLKTKKNVEAQVPKGQDVDSINHDAEYKHFYVTSKVENKDDEYTYYIWQFDMDGGSRKKIYSRDRVPEDGDFSLYVNRNGLFIEESTGTFNNYDDAFKSIDPNTGETAEIYKYHTN